MYDSRRDILDALAAAPDGFGQLVAGIDADLARRARGGDEGWSVVEVACHLRDAEERTLERVVAMRDTPNPKLPGYDQEAWAIERDYAAGDLAAALGAYTATRGRLVGILEALPAEGWARPGVHDEAGPVTIESLLAHIVSHDVQHLGQIARALRDVGRVAA